ncbi:uncharacterized protein [Littorina saxatilis]|uniref:uncharacterized protein n=1 Tax=Littorina saxatilis TaxID=31220 RepID=UPI0038B6364A
MECESCHGPITDSDVFCPECGTPRKPDRRCVHCQTPIKAKQKICSGCGKSPELKCPCGASLKLAQKFCRSCGEVVQQPVKKKVCPKCSADAEDGDKFCPDCGHALENIHPLPSSVQCSEVQVPKKHDGSPSASTEEPESSQSDGAAAGNEDGNTSLGESKISNEEPASHTVGENDNSVAGKVPVTEDKKKSEVSGNCEKDYPASAEQQGNVDPHTPDSKDGDGPALVTSTAGTQNSMPEKKNQTDRQEGSVSAGAGNYLPQEVLHVGTQDNQAQDFQSILEGQESSVAGKVPVTEDKKKSEVSGNCEKDYPASAEQQGNVDPHTPDSKDGDGPALVTSTAGTQNSMPEKKNQTDRQEGSVPAGAGNYLPQEVLHVGTQDNQAQDFQSILEGQESSVAGKVPVTEDKKKSEVSGNCEKDYPASAEQQGNVDPHTPDSKDGDGPALVTSTAGTQNSMPEKKNQTDRQEGSVPAGAGNYLPQEVLHVGTQDNQAQDFQSILEGQESSVDDYTKMPASPPTESAAAASKMELGSATTLGVAGSQTADPDESDQESGENLTQGDFEELEEDYSDSEHSSEDLQEEESSMSRDSSQMREQKRKKRHPRNRNAKARKRQKKKEIHHPDVVHQNARVVFHVIISRKFKQLEKNNCRVFVCMNPDEQSLHGATQLHFTERNDECGYLYEGNMDISKLPKNCSKVPYKYCVELDGQIAWEKIYYHKAGARVKDNAKRELYIPNQRQLSSAKGTWNVYDWMAYPNNMTGMMDSLWRVTHLRTSSKDIFNRDVIPACGLFLPSPDTIMNALCNHVEILGQSAEDFLKKMKIIASSQPFAATSQDVEKFFCECIERFLLNNILEQVKAAVTLEKPTVVVAVFLLQLSQQWKVAVPQDDKEIIFKALLIRPDMENKTCPDIDYLAKHFPTLMEEKKNPVQKLLLPLCMANKRDRSCSWIYCIPLVHLLSEDCQPFHDPPLSEEHRTPVWWGTRRVEDKIKVFKEASQAEHMFEIGMCEGLSQAFKADPLMLRSFIATLSLDRALRVLTSDIFPVEVVLASLFFHLHTNQRACKNKEKDIVNILRSTATVIREAAGLTSEPKAKVAEHFKLMGAIAEDVMKEVIETNRTSETVIQAAVLVQLSILTFLARDDQKTKRVEVLIENTLYFLKTWFRGFQAVNCEWDIFIKLIEECMQISEELHQTLAIKLKKNTCKYVKELLQKVGVSDIRQNQ